MALLHDILAWSLELPQWQRDALRRLLESGAALSEADLDQLYVLFKHGYGLAKQEELSALPLAAEHIPTEVKAGQVVVLKAIRDLQHVNRIPSDQSIAFAICRLNGHLWRECCRQVWVCPRSQKGLSIARQRPTHTP